jgi:GNAT superfamily N-acetyltransferase
MTSTEVSLRPATADDAEFAYRTTWDTMRDYVLATWGTWNEDEVRCNIAESIAAGHTQVIELADSRIGIHAVERAPDHIQLWRIFILPEYQRRGIGSDLIERLLAEARGAGLPVRLRVLRVNPAFALYKRMGFKVTEATPERYFMEHPL